MTRTVLSAVAIGCSAAAVLYWITAPRQAPAGFGDSARTVCIERVRSDAGHDAPLRLGQPEVRAMSSPDALEVRIPARRPGPEDAGEMTVRCVATSIGGAWQVSDIGVLEPPA